MHVLIPRVIRKKKYQGKEEEENARGGDEENHQIPWEPASGEFTITCSLLINCELDLIN